MPLLFRNPGSASEPMYLLISGTYTVYFNDRVSILGCGRVVKNMLKIESSPHSVGTKDPAV